MDLCRLGLVSSVMQRNECIVRFGEGVVAEEDLAVVAVGLLVIRSGGRRFARAADCPSPFSALPHSTPAPCHGRGEGEGDCSGNAHRTTCSPRPE